MSNLSLANLPHNASDRELRDWIESRGIGTKSIRIVRDVVTNGTSSAVGQVELKESIDLDEAIAVLHGKRMRSQTVLASGIADSPIMTRPFGASAAS